MKFYKSYIFLLLAAVCQYQISLAQHNFTITYRSSFYTDDSLAPNRPFVPLLVVVQDSVAYNYYPSALEGRHLKVPVPLGSGYWPKSSYYDSKKKIEVYVQGHYDKPKQWRLIERINDAGNWRITDEKKTILGFLCTKAIGTKNGKKCTVWFSPEIGGNFGPYTMTNLPGTILEILYQEDGLRTIAYEISDEALPIVEPNFCKRIRSR